MVTWTDFLQAPPWAEEWHLLIGIAVMFIAAYLFRINPYFGIALTVAFVGLVLVKEFYVDVVLEGATVAGGTVDAIWFLAGGILGTVAGITPPRYAIVVLPVVLIVPTVLLFAGVV